MYSDETVVICYAKKIILRALNYYSIKSAKVRKRAIIRMARSVRDSFVVLSFNFIRCKDVYRCNYFTTPLMYSQSLAM